MKYSCPRTGGRLILLNIKYRQEYESCIFKIAVTKGPLEFNISVLGLLTLAFLEIIWWNFVQVEIRDSTLTIQRGFLKKTKPKIIPLDDLRDIVLTSQRGFPTGDDLTILAISIATKEYIFSIYSIQKGL